MSEKDNDNLLNIKLSEKTLKVLNSLTSREKEVLRRRFGMDSNKDATFNEIEKDFFVSKERIRQIEAKALKKLRRDDDPPDDIA